MPRALDLVLEITGKSRAARTAMMAMTTSSSIRVNASTDFILESASATVDVPRHSSAFDLIQFLLSLCRHGFTTGRRNPAIIHYASSGQWHNHNCHRKIAGLKSWEITLFEVSPFELPPVDSWKKDTGGF
jgi:hypothetical protein